MLREKDCLFLFLAIEMVLHTRVRMYTQYVEDSSTDINSTFAFAATSAARWPRDAHQVKLSAPFVYSLTSEYSLYCILVIVAQQKSTVCAIYRFNVQVTLDLVMLRAFFEIDQLL